MIHIRPPFHKQLRKVRKAIGMPQKELAAFTNLKPSAISRFECTSVDPSLKNFYRLADALGVTLDGLAGGRGKEDLIVLNVKDMSLADARAELMQRVYDVGLFFELCEGKQVWKGNGHHAAQKLANVAAEMLEVNWCGKR